MYKRQILRYLELWTATTKEHVVDRMGNFAPVPSAYLDGMPHMQTQHTCILLEDVTDHCNLRCPTCFADSAPDRLATVALADILASVDARLERERGRLDVVMLSGGEPTLHPDFAQLLDELVKLSLIHI